MSATRETVTPEGRLVLTEAAVAAVVRGAALRCPGVVATAARGLPDEIRGLLRREGEGGEGGAYGVEVELDAEHLAVTVDIVVAFGAHIPSVAEAVLAAAAADLQEQAGIRPRRLRVRVQGVRPAPAAERRAAGRGAG